MVLREALSLCWDLPYVVNYLAYIVASSASRGADAPLLDDRHMTMWAK